MKKLAIYLFIILALFAILFFINQQTKKANNDMYIEDAQRLYSTTPETLDSETRKQLNNPEYQNIMLPNELQEKIDNKESFYVYFFSPRCHICVNTTPRLNDIAEESNVELHQYNVLEFEQAWSEYQLSGTPTLMYFKNGVPQLNEAISGGYSDANENEQVNAAFNSFFDHYENPES